MPEDITPPPPPRRVRPATEYLTWDAIQPLEPLRARASTVRFTEILDEMNTAMARPTIESMYPVGTHFHGGEQRHIADALPVGASIEGLGDRLLRTRMDDGMWEREDGYRPSSLGGRYMIVSYPVVPVPEVTPPRPRYTNGRFVSAADASRPRIGDVVRTNSRPSNRANAGGGFLRSEFANTDMVLLGRRRTRPGLWTAKRVGETDPYNTAAIHENSFSLVTRDPSIVEVEMFEVGDRVLIDLDPRVTRTDAGFYEPGFGGEYGFIRDTEVYDGETYNVTLEGGRRRTTTIWAGSLTLIERDGLVTEAGRNAPPRPIVCVNEYCGRTLSSEEDRVNVQYPLNRTGCSACTQTCVGCGHVHIAQYGMIYSINDEMHCSDCAERCDDCDTYFIDDDDEGCPNWENHEMPRGVHGYQHTPASMWLGGPVPKREDGKIDTSQPGAYYVGIELEISASYEQSAMPIYDWAEEHLGHRDAIVCKEDSSVRGFEIVTQPMTPQLFESVNWESFMDLINTNHPLSRDDEPTEHGLHVHIGRIAFDRDDVAQAAYSYLLSQGDHLERIGRRAAYHYCAKVRHPVSAHISTMGRRKTTKQTRKVERRGIMAGRDAVNLQNDATIEVRAFRSTRNADYLRNAVRLTYIAAEYIRYLRVNKEAVSPKSLHWDRFAAWVGEHYPEAHASIAGVESEGSNKRVLVGASTTPVANFDM